MRKMKNYYKTNTSHYAKCRTLMIRFRNRHRIRCFLTSVALFANCYFHVITLPVLYYNEVDRIYGLLWGCFAYAVNLIIFIAMFFAAEKNQRLLNMLLILIAVSTVIGFLHPYAGIGIGLLFLTQIPDCMKMKWIARQQGYPYFNERYQLQQDYKRFAKEFIQDSDTPGIPEELRRNQIVVFSMPDEEKSFYDT